MPSYERAITIFSPNGRLFQVEYATEAVKRSNTAVAVRGADCVVLAAERKAQSKLQDRRTVYKICPIDDNMHAAFAGLMADARVVVDDARVAAQSYRLMYGEPPSIEYLTRHIAELMQTSTQRAGRRPFGVAAICAGVDSDGTPRLYVAEPGGTYASWRAAATGRSAKIVRDILEAECPPGRPAPDEATATTIAAKALLEVAEAGARNIEVVVVRRGAATLVSDADLDAIVSRLEAAKAAARAIAAGHEPAAAAPAAAPAAADAHAME